jgi:hypothetical protein
MDGLPISSSRHIPRMKRIPRNTILFLTHTQLTELTGFKSSKKQCQWLSAAGYRFDCRADGRPMVLLAQLLERQCRNPVPDSAQPDLSWMS